MHTQNTWGLSTDWDLQFDANGKPEVLTEAQAITQNVCNECRLFLHDAYFRYEDGIPWFSDQLGKPIQVSVVTARLRQAALRVPGVLRVLSITIEELEKKTRILTGTIEIETEYGYGKGRI